MRRRTEFEQLYEREYPGVVRMAYVMLGDPAAAEDVAQETFARLYLHVRKVARYEQPGAWLRRVAIQQAIRARRKWPHQRLDDDHDAPTRGAMPDMDLRRALDALPPSQRAAIVLHYFEGQPVEGVAGVLGCSEGTAKTHLHRGRKNLAAALGEVTEDVVR